MFLAKQQMESGIVEWQAIYFVIKRRFFLAILQQL